MPTGTAIAMAMIEVTTVPKIAAPRAEILGDRIPDLRGEEAEAEGLKSGDRPLDQRDDRPAEDQQHDQRRALSQSTEEIVARGEPANGLAAGVNPLPAASACGITMSAIHTLSEPSSGGAAEAGRQTSESRRPRTPRLPRRRISWPRTPACRRAARSASPGLLDERDDRRGQRHVVELFGRLGAVGVGPGEELERVGGRVGIVGLLMHQDEGRSGDRPGVRARLVGQDDVEIGRTSPNRRSPQPPGRSRRSARPSCRRG